jgi:hypothetical protein
VSYRPANTFDWNPKWARTLLSLIYFSWDIYRDPFHKQNFKYQSWYLTPCSGLEVQKPTQAFQSVKGLANTFDWNPKWERTLLFLIYLSWDIHRDPLHKQNFKYQRWYLTSYCGLEVQKPTQTLQSVKDPANTFDWNPKWERTLLSLIYVSWDINRDPLHKHNFRYQRWYSTLCCGLEVQKPTQALQSVNGQANTVDWNPKLARTVLSLIHVS